MLFHKYQSIVQRIFGKLQLPELILESFLIFIFEDLLDA